MKRLPCLLPLAAKRPDDTDSVVFAVYAPFGTDRVLSEFPDDKRKAVRQQPLVKHLLAVARQGVHVSALIDLFEDDSYLVEIPAYEPRQMAIHSAWKQRMNAPQALAGFLRRTHDRFPCSTLVLALEGHGAGYLPEIDGSAISPDSTSGSGTVVWELKSDGITPTKNGAPILAVSVYPELPVESPEFIPPNLPLSTWALGFALRSAIKDGVPRPAVIHFNNCFNMSLEVLHTVAPHADFATGYANYNFFTAGEAYPEVFKELRAQFAKSGPVTREQLAKWFATKNGALLQAKQNHPSVGATIALRRMAGVLTALNDLAKELTDALKSAGGNGVRSLVKTAVLAAQQFDTGQTYQLEVPDQLTDLADLATQLMVRLPTGTIHDKAEKLVKALAGVWQYGGLRSPVGRREPDLGLPQSTARGRTSSFRTRRSRTCGLAHAVLHEEHAGDDQAASAAACDRLPERRLGPFAVGEVPDRIPPRSDPAATPDQAAARQGARLPDLRSQLQAQAGRIRLRQGRPTRETPPKARVGLMRPAGPRVA